jgi:type II secretory pathway component PulF
MLMYSLRLTPEPFTERRIVSMKFPELTTITNNIGDFVKALGAGLFIAVLGVIALIFMTSFGNERRNMLAKSAIVMAFVGLGLIVASTTVQTVIKAVFGG